MKRDERRRMKEERLMIEILGGRAMLCYPISLTIAVTTPATAMIVPTFHLMSSAFILAISTLILVISSLISSLKEAISSLNFVDSLKKVSLVTSFVIVDILQLYE